MTGTIDTDSLPPPSLLSIRSTDALPTTDPLGAMRHAWTKEFTQELYEKLSDCSIGLTYRLRARGVFDVAGDDLLNDVLRRTYAGTVTWHHERKIPLAVHVMTVMWHDCRALVHKRRGETAARSESSASTNEFRGPARDERAHGHAIDSSSERDRRDPDGSQPDDELRTTIVQEAARACGDDEHDTSDVPTLRTTRGAPLAVEDVAAEDDPVRRMEQRSLLRRIEDALFRLSAMNADPDLRAAMTALFQGGARGEQDVMALTGLDLTRARRAWRTVRRLILELPDDLRAEARELM